MAKHDTKRLENRIGELRSNCALLADTSDLESFVRLIHNPGYTTPAEHALLQGIVDAMAEQTKALLSLRRLLISAAEKVELNPQPLPPRV